MGKQVIKSRLILIQILLAIFLMSTFVCTNQQTEKTSDSKIGVIVSILPQAEFVERVGGDKVKVTVMVPPGASPHTYEPKPGQLKEVSRAKVYFAVGSGIEFELAWMKKIVDLSTEILVLDCSEGIEIKEGDPHIWLSPFNAMIMVENIYQGLVQVDSVNKKYYSENKNKYIEELNKLDEELTLALSEKKNRKIMVYHPSWGYFTREYDLEQIPIEREGKEPTPKGILNSIKQAREEEITTIFASPQFDAKKAEVIAKEIGGDVVLLDPLSKDYIENMRKVALAFSRDLR